MKCSSKISEEESFILIASAVFSILCCLFLIIYLINKSALKDFFCRILLYLSISTSVRSFFECFQIEPLINYRNLCVIIAYFKTTANLSIIVWSLFISFVLYQALINFEYNYFKHHSRFLFIAYIAAPAITLVPIFTGSFWNNNGICFFKNDETGNILRILLSTTPNFIMAIIGTAVYCRIWIKMRPYDSQCTWKILFVRGYIFIIITVLIFLPAVGVRTYNFIGNNCVPSELYVFAECWLNLSGFLNIISYLLYSKAKEKFRRVSLTGNLIKVNDQSRSQNSITN